jgi:hypothetical protein
MSEFPRALKHTTLWLLLGMVLLLAGTELLLVPLVAFLFQAPLLAHPVWLAAIMMAGTIGVSSVGTLFAAMLVRVCEVRMFDNEVTTILFYK